MISIDELERRLDSAAGLERLLVMTRLAKQVASRDYERARSLAYEACILSYVLDKRDSAVDVMSARTTALLVLVFCEEIGNSSDSSDVEAYTEEAYSILADLPYQVAARILLRVGQLYQQAGRYSRAFYFFREAESYLNSNPDTTAS